ncbi:MAG: L-threonylcarbamoyladenylate synthase [Saprospiraceae bacterium]
MTLSEEARYTGSLILKNKSILYPTDTVWGLGANIHDEVSVRRLSEIKLRPVNKSFILLVDSLEMLSQYVIRIHPRVETMLYYHVQPVTIIYPRARNLPEYLLAEDQSIAIRVCKDMFCQELIAFIGQPLISTSANYSGKETPSNFSEIDPSLLDKVDYVVRHRQNDKSKSKSSVIARYDEEGVLYFIR